MPDATTFFARPGDYYLVRVTFRINVRWLGIRVIDKTMAFEFGIKADDEQLPFAREIVAQIAGGVRALAGTVEMKHAQQVTRLPGNREAYAVTPPTQHVADAGRHRKPEEHDAQVARNALEHFMKRDYSHITDADA